MRTFGIWGALGCVFVLVGCPASPNRAPQEILAEGVPKADRMMELEGVSIRRFEADRVVVEADLKFARIDRERGVAMGEAVRIRTLEPDSGITRVEVSAPRGRADFGPQTLLLEGGVRARDREGRRLETERLEYAGSTDAFSAPGPVVLTGSNFRAEGASLVGHARAQDLEVQGPIGARVAPARH